MSIDEIKAMPIDERLRLMEEIWESLSENDQAINSPAWHEAVLDERRKRIASGEATFLTFDQLKERFRR
jgi:putative addiction module component (TIGR02574 family)